MKTYDEIKAEGPMRIDAMMHPVEPRFETSP
jgi:hypothetical protein